jgi:hypothetical protein
MKAIKVTVNGKVKYIAGAEDLAVLSAIVNISPQSKKLSNTDLFYSVGGLSTEGLFKDWDTFGELHIGDSITFEILETDVVNKPFHTHRRDDIK